MNRNYTVIERMWITEAERHTQVDDEEWVVDPKFPGYVVSSYGQVYSFRSHRLLQPSWSGDGGAYKQVTVIDKNQQSRSIGVHRLMAIVFLGAPNEGDEANHIDGYRQIITSVT